MAPEYAMGGIFSEKSDVFSFGVLLMEIVSGRRNVSFNQGEESSSLLGSVSFGSLVRFFQLPMSFGEKYRFAGLVFPDFLVKWESSPFELCFA